MNCAKTSLKTMRFHSHPILDPITQELTHSITSHKDQLPPIDDTCNIASLIFLVWRTNRRKYRINYYMLVQAIQNAIRDGNFAYRPNPLHDPDAWDLFTDARKKGNLTAHTGQWCFEISVPVYYSHARKPVDRIIDAFGILVLLSTHDAYNRKQYQNAISILDQTLYRAMLNACNIRAGLCAACVNPNCNNGTICIKSALDGPNARCDECGALQCLLCKCLRENHPLICGEVNPNVIMSLPVGEFLNYVNGNTQQCPQCGIATTKMGGCNIMTCPNIKCQVYWCWVCYETLHKYYDLPNEHGIRPTADPHWHHQSHRPNYLTEEMYPLCHLCDDLFSDVRLIVRIRNLGGIYWKCFGEYLSTIRSKWSEVVAAINIKASTPYGAIAMPTLLDDPIYQTIPWKNSAPTYSFFLELTSLVVQIKDWLGLRQIIKYIDPIVVTEIVKLGALELRCKLCSNHMSSDVVDGKLTDHQCGPYKPACKYRALPAYSDEYSDRFNFTTLRYIKDILFEQTLIRNAKDIMAQCTVSQLSQQVSVCALHMVRHAVTDGLIRAIGETSIPERNRNDVKKEHITANCYAVTKHLTGLLAKTSEQFNYYAAVVKTGVAPDTLVPAPHELSDESIPERPLYYNASAAIWDERLEEFNSVGNLDTYQLIRNINRCLLELKVAINYLKRREDALFKDLVDALVTVFFNLEGNFKTCPSEVVNITEKIRANRLSYVEYAAYQFIKYFAVRSTIIDAHVMLDAHLSPAISIYTSGHAVSLRTRDVVEQLINDAKQQTTSLDFMMKSTKHNLNRFDSAYVGYLEELHETDSGVEIYRQPL